MRAGPREQISMAGPAGSCRCAARWTRGPGRRLAHRRRPHELNALWGHRALGAAKGQEGSFGHKLNVTPNVSHHACNKCNVTPSRLNWV